MTLQSEINTSGFFTYIEWNGGSNYWSAPTQYTPNITSFPGASITHSIFVSSMSAITESLGATSTPIGFSVGCIFITYGTWQAGTIYLTLQCYENSVWRDTEIWDTAYIPSGINAITIFFRDRKSVV